MAKENWLLSVIKQGIDPTNEANTSRYVHEVLLNCFSWPFEAICPQNSKRGFIDYRLQFPKQEVDLHVEVKPFGSSLREGMIRKYVVKPGRMSEDFQVGVLTNLVEWQIFAAGPMIKQVAGDSMALIVAQEIDSRSSIAELDRLIGYRPNAELREIRAALGESTDILRYLMHTDHSIMKAISLELKELRDRHELDVSVPQHETLGAHIEALLDGSWDNTCPFSPAKLGQALGSLSVAEAANESLMRTFGSRSQVARIRDLMRTIVKACKELGAA